MTRPHAVFKIKLFFRYNILNSRHRDLESNNRDMSRTQNQATLHGINFHDYTREYERE